MRKLFLLNLLVCLVLGCGTSSYESRIGQRSGPKKADNLPAAEDLPGTKVSIRMPGQLGQPLVEDANNAKRVKPGLFVMPGLKRTYETFAKDSEGGEWPFYCYIGVVEGADAKDITGKIRGELGNNAGQWQDFQADAPDGGKIAWKMLRFTSDQEFYVKDKTGQGNSRPGVAGLLEVYVHEGPATTVVVAWRVPAFIEPTVGLANLTKTTAAGVSVKP